MDPNRSREGKNSTRTFPFVKFVDLGEHGIKKQEISIANIQIETPIHFFAKTKPPELTLEAEDKQKEKIFRLATEAIQRHADLIVLPELSTSANLCKQMKERFSNSKSIIVMGSHYDEYSQNISLILADGKFYGQIKNNPSPEERDYMRRSNDVSVFINTPIGDFAVLICYDATDFSILTAIEGYTDFLICVARTRDVITFRNIFSALTYLQYQYVVFCNDAKYGGSSFYLPFHRNRMLDALGQKNEGVIHRNFDVRKLDGMRAKPRRDRIFKYPPASVKPRHIPNVDEDCRVKEHFESKSFNYLSYVRTFEILNSFLAHVNISRGLSSIGGKESASIYRLDDFLSKSCQAMYAPAIAIRAMKLNPVVTKYFLMDLSESLCENSEKLFEKNRRQEIVERLLNIKGKQYLLFEIDLDTIRDASLRAPELVDEIARVYSIEKQKKLRTIPNELQIRRNCSNKN